MKQKIRTFVAVELDSGTRNCAAELINQLRGAGADVKWVEPHNLHVTLKFLGDVDTREMYQVCRGVEGAVAGMPPFALELRGAGAFPNANRPRTVWLGVGGGTAEMITLNEQIEEAMEELGFRREARRYQPHLTVGRVRRGGPGVSELGELIRRHAEFEIGRSPVSEVVVFSSRLDRSGPTYEALARAPLGAE